MSVYNHTAEGMERSDLFLTRESNKFRTYYLLSGKAE